MVHFFDLSREDLEGLLQSWGMPRFRTGQLLKWVYERGVIDPEQFTDFSKADRQKLADNLRFATWRINQHQRATDGTQKLLLEVGTRNVERGMEEAASDVFSVPHSALRVPRFLSTECVMIPADNAAGGTRRTACISSQVGCPVGCRFCASGLGGLEANLTAGQIVEQIWQLNSQLGTWNAERNKQFQVPGSQFPVRITNVVFMGMGEPLSNFDAVTRAVRTLHADWGFGISARRITISTVGVPSSIRRLADQIDLPITLALSLHAPNDELRRKLIPWAESTSIDKLVEACNYYFDKTGREITIEYILLRQVNDQVDHARQLAAVTKRMRCNVNLIRYNEVRGLPFNRPDSEDVHRFQHTLASAGVNVHIRASRGRDIAAACGQLRHEQKTSV
ncbi:23S rRNA (adenine(2503)-C(2))-methyltransferase RlmN [Planctomycetales bacterium ZRK34]|nr:23S rRNA (adenine(2503)-C(2))-methyltransferase RlmN [Planctomycetales bacterium ZRK34]